MRTLAVLTLIVGAAACAKAPPVEIVPIEPPRPTFEQKLAWIPRLEDRRILREPGAALPLEPAFTPDLITLLHDDDARLRRRAALAVGRVGLREGVDSLVALLSDPEPEVRQVAAFALGLLGDARAGSPLASALADPSPLVQGSAAEALGLLGEVATASAIGRMASLLAQAGTTVGNDVETGRDSPATALRLAIYALARLKAYEPLAGVVLDASGQPLMRSWPVAYALQRVEEPKALPALLTLAGDEHPFTRAFAIKGLGILRDRTAVPTLIPLAGHKDRSIAIEAVRALGLIGDPAAADALMDVAAGRETPPVLQVEAVEALGGTGGAGVADFLVDLLPHRGPHIRAAALNSLARRDPEGFVAILSGIDPDRDWRVRSALATALGTLPAEAGLPRLRLMLADQDQRVVPAVLASLTRLQAPEATEVMLERLKADDPVVRAAAATALGELKPVGGVDALTSAYQTGQRDATYVTRAATVNASIAFGAEATSLLTQALDDKDWVVRVRAAALLAQLDPSSDAHTPIRPAPSHVSRDLYEADRIVSPRVSTQAFIDTDRGTIQLELAVLDAPLTVENFVALARKGLFDGLAVHRLVPNVLLQTGDPRGDGHGGPGHTIHDEINQRSFLRGTIGMARDLPEAGGSQFFITLMPQPQFDARYTAFGQVIAGMDVADQIQPGDVVRRVRVWDGVVE